jgi:hypothetical protein
LPAKLLILAVATWVVDEEIPFWSIGIVVCGFVLAAVTGAASGEAGGQPPRDS